jgi:hypothetical protein
MFSDLVPDGEQGSLPSPVFRDTADALPTAAMVSSVPDMREERTETDGIPARVYDPGNASALLLLGHGGSHGKDSETAAEPVIGESRLAQ